MAASLKEGKPKTIKKKTTKKKTKKKAASKKAVKKLEPETSKVLDVRINSEFLVEVIKMKEAIGYADEATVVFRALALLQEVVRRQELGYDLCFLEKSTQKLVLVDLGGPKDAGGS